jgi:hypothetical protein
VVAFNTAKGWSRDVTREIAQEVARRREVLETISTMPIEYFRGEPLTPDDLDAMRRQIEELDSIDEIDPEVRAIVARNWPHLLAKLPPDPDE